MLKGNNSDIHGIFLRFSGCTLCRPLIHTFIFWYLKVIKVVHSQVSFFYIWVVVLEFSISRSLPNSRKYHSSLLLGGFLDLIPQNVVKFVWNFDLWLNTRKHIQYETVFRKKWSKWSQETDFLARFWEFFVCAFLRSVI